MRVIRSHVIVLISLSQNELQHPERMQELPELGIHSEATRPEGKIWLDGGGCLEGTCVECGGSCGTSWQCVCHWDYWEGSALGALQDQWKEKQIVDFVTPELHVILGRSNGKKEILYEEPNSAKTRLSLLVMNSSFPSH